MMNILTIAGSDSSAGAGIQGDMKTILAHGAHPLTVVTAITAQNTTSVLHVESVDSVDMQLKALSSDIPIHGIKIGMVYSQKAVRDIINFISTYKDIPIVLDPVMISSTGNNLIEKNVLNDLIYNLMPLVNLITPNLLEAKFLADIFNISLDLSKETSLVKSLYDHIKVPILLKGGHSKSSNNCIDILYDGEKIYQFAEHRFSANHSHGTGCCLSSAITCRMSQGHNLADAINMAKIFVTQAIKHGYSLGKGEGPVDPLIHFITNTVTMNSVANTCIATGGRPIMAESISEIHELTPSTHGLVLNLGTLNDEKIASMLTALNFIKEQPVLLDPVACGSSTFRKETALNMLRTGKITVLKLNAREAKGLLGHDIKSACGVDCDASSLDESLSLAGELINSYPNLIVIITGKIDIIATKDKTIRLQGGTGMQGHMTGTGCILNAVIMNRLVKNKQALKGVIEALRQMNRASEIATSKLNNKCHHIQYQSLLIDTLSVLNSGVYLITDDTMTFEELYKKTELALENGVRWLQYRNKNASYESKLSEAKKLRDLTIAYGVNLIINDDINLALDVYADGVHLGQNDTCITEARKMLGPRKIIGATAKTVEQAKLATAQSADYLGVGALNPSSTKSDAIAVNSDTLQAIRQTTHLPIFGIGGIRYNNLTEDQLAFLDGVAIVSAYYKEGLESLKKLQSLL